MRDPDYEVPEVRCCKTGRAMPKIPSWLATVRVKFVSTIGEEPLAHVIPPIVASPDAESSPYDEVIPVSTITSAAPTFFNPNLPLLAPGIKEDEMAQRYDNLLIWLAAQGEGSYSRLRDICSRLELVNASCPTSSILRSLRLLGHLEMSEDGRRWACAPTAVVTGDFHTDLIFLCGGRNNLLKQEIRSSINISEDTPLNGDAPHRWRFWSNTRQIKALSASNEGRIIFVGNASQHMAEALPPLIEGMRVVEGIKAASFDRIERLECNGFREVNIVNRTGFYQLFLRRDDAKPRYMLCYDAEVKRWYGGDWYGRRYLSRILQHEVSIVYYQSQEGRVFIACDWRWPELYERVLTLASGQLPRRHQNWLVYEHVSATTLELLKPKLSLDIIAV